MKYAIHTSIDLKTGSQIIKMPNNIVLIISPTPDVLELLKKLPQTRKIHVFLHTPNSPYNRECFNDEIKCLKYIMENIDTSRLRTIIHVETCSCLKLSKEYKKEIRRELSGFNNYLIDGTTVCVYFGFNYKESMNKLRVFNNHGSWCCCV